MPRPAVGSAAGRDAVFLQMAKEISGLSQFVEGVTDNRGGEGASGLGQSFAQTASLGSVFGGRFREKVLDVEDVLI